MKTYKAKFPDHYVKSQIRQRHIFVKDPFIKIMPTRKCNVLMIVMKTEFISRSNKI